jgi:hypothetical protein
LKVGSKIFTLAAVLVAGTTAVALYSLDRIAAVNREIVTVATYHAPLARILNDIEIEARNQELAYYALLARRPGQERGGAPGRDALQQVAASGRAVDAAMGKALALAREGLERAKSEADRIKFAKLQPMFETISREHVEFNAQLREVVQSGGGADPVKLALIEKEIRDLNRVLDDADHRLHAMTEESAAAAAVPADAARRVKLGARSAGRGARAVAVALAGRAVEAPGQRHRARQAGRS